MDERLRGELLLLRGENLVLAGDTVEGRDCCRRVAALAHSIGDGALEARAALAFAGDFTFAVEITERITLLEGALAAIGDSDGRLRARVMARLSSALNPSRSEEATPPPIV